MWEGWTLLKVMLDTYRAGALTGVRSETSQVWTLWEVLCVGHAAFS